MTRHAKNCTAGAVYTYHEKKKDTKASGYGTQAMRLGKDSMSDFDCCALTLQPCRDPVVTPDGVLFDKEAILEYVIRQKKDIARQMKLYEKQKQKSQTEMEELGAAEDRSKMEKFLQKEKTITSQPHNPFKTVPESGPSISNMNESKNKTLPSFWIPSLTPEAKPITVKKPDSHVRCPVTGNVLKIKNLIPVKFTPIVDPDDKSALIVKQNRYMCAVTHDVLGNTVPAAVLRTSNSVVTVECVEKLLKKDMIDPIDGKKMTEKDIIYLQMGGTGYASTNVKLEATFQKPPIQA